MTEDEDTTWAVPPLVATGIGIAAVVGAALLILHDGCDSASTYVAVALLVSIFAVGGEAITSGGRGGEPVAAVAWALISAFVMCLAIVIAFLVATSATGGCDWA